MRTQRFPSGTGRMQQRQKQEELARFLYQSLEEAAQDQYRKDLVHHQDFA